MRAVTMELTAGHQAYYYLGTFTYIIFLNDPRQGCRSPGHGWENPVRLDVMHNISCPLHLPALGVCVSTGELYNFAHLQSDVGPNHPSALVTEAVNHRIDDGVELHVRTFLAPVDCHHVQ